jgi:hypothetical protein
MHGGEDYTKAPPQAYTQASHHAREKCINIVTYIRMYTSFT